MYLFVSLGLNLPPGLRGLRTPFMIGGSIAWNNTATVGTGVDWLFHRTPLVIWSCNRDNFNMARELGCHGELVVLRIGCMGGIVRAPHYRKHPSRTRTDPVSRIHSPWED
jgi:hypothetical protein